MCVIYIILQLDMIVWW